MQERKCFVCRGFEYITYHCRNREEIEKNRRAKVRGPKHWPSSDKSEVLTSRVMLWDALDMNNFYFLFLLFSDFIGIFFSFSFLLDDEEAHVKKVT